MDNHLQILIVDPHDADRQYYVQRLKSSSSDYVILEAVTGLAGLELYNKYVIDCVVLEIDLPDVSGFEVLVKLVPRARHPVVHIVVLTRLEHSGFLDLAVRNGACKALQKKETSGDVLGQAETAMAKIRREKCREHDLGVPEPMA